MTTVGIIPARGGSKGIPMKNIAQCAGKPLLAWTIEAAIQSTVLDIVVISSEAFPMINFAVDHAAGPHNKLVLYPRPPELAQDNTPLEPVIQDVLNAVTPEATEIVLLQPTSPVRTGAQIDEAITLLRSGYDSILSVSPFHGFIWVDQLEPDRARIQRPFPPPAWGARPRRQDFLPTFKENGSIYVTTSAQWERTGNRLGGRVGLYEMPERCGFEVDSPFDLWLVEQILKAGEL